MQRGQLICDYSNCKINIRFDNGKPYAFRAAKADDGSSTILFISDYDSMLMNLKKKKKAYIEARFYRGGSHVFEFNITDLKW